MLLADLALVAAAIAWDVVEDFFLTALWLLPDASVCSNNDRSSEGCSGDFEAVPPEEV